MLHQPRVGPAIGNLDPFGDGRLFVFQETLPNSVTVDFVEHREVLRELHPGGSLATRSTISVADLTPHRGDDESDEERENETNDSEHKLRDVVVLIASEARKSADA